MLASEKLCASAAWVGIWLAGPVLSHWLAGKELARKMKDKGIDVVMSVRTRSLAETAFDELKNLCQIEHTWHRSFSNFAVNLMAGIVAYCLSSAKPRIALRGLSGHPGRELTSLLIQNSG